MAEAAFARSLSSFALRVFVILASLSSSLGAQDLVIGEVLLDPVGVNTGRQIVEIRNLSNDPVLLGDENIWLRFAPNSWRFPPGSAVGGGGSVLVHINRSGSSTPLEFFTGSARNLKTADSLALYKSNLFQDPSKLLHFVQWGAGAQGGEDVAVAKGIWPEGEAVGIEALRAGATLSYLRDQAGIEVPAAVDALGAWCLDGSPTLGAVNDECTISAVQTGIRFQEIGLRGTGLGGADQSSSSFVEITNTGDVLEDLGAFSLTMEGLDVYDFPGGTILAPGDLLLVYLGGDGVDTSSEKYTGSDLFGSLEKSGSLSLHARGVAFEDPTGIVDFVLWGADDAPLFPSAQAAGLWPDAIGVSTQGLHASGALVAIDGVGVAGWSIDNTPTPGLSNDADPAPSVVVINELLLDPLGENSGQQAIELTNRHSALSFDLSGVTLCVTSSAAIPATSCYTFPEETSIAPEDFIVVRWNSEGGDDAQEVFTGPIEDLGLDGGDAALYLSSNVDDVDNLTDFVRWGESSGSTVEVAVAVGLWTTDESVSVVGLQDDSSLAYVEADPGQGEGTLDGAESYRVDNTPSLGESNDERRGQQPFIRGDCNDDGSIDISDAVASFDFLFNGGAQPLCRNACDTNNDNSVDISDPVFLLNYLFRGAEQPDNPGRDGLCGRSAGFVEPPCDAFVSCP